MRCISQTPHHPHSPRSLPHTLVLPLIRYARHHSLPPPPQPPSHQSCPLSHIWKRWWCATHIQFLVQLHVAIIVVNGQLSIPMCVRSGTSGSQGSRDEQDLVLLLASKALNRMARAFSKLDLIKRGFLH